MEDFIIIGLVFIILIQYVIHHVQSTALANLEAKIIGVGIKVEAVALRLEKLVKQV